MVRELDSHFIRHTHQFSHRTRTHFPQKPAAMDLGSCFTGSDCGGNLLVRTAGDQKRQDSALARCQQCKTTSEQPNFCLMVPPLAVLFECDVNGIQQVLAAEWLG